MPFFKNLFIYFLKHLLLIIELLLENILKYIELLLEQKDRQKYLKILD